MTPRLRDELIELNEIPAPPFGEDERGRRFAEMLREAGLDDVTIDAEGNVIGRRQGRSGERDRLFRASRHGVPHRDRRQRAR